MKGANMKVLLLFVVLYLAGCVDEEAKRQAEAEQRLAETKLELERTKIAEQQRIEEQERQQEEAERMAYELEQERLMQMEQEKEENRVEQFDANGIPYIRGEIANACNAQSEFRCNSIDVISFEYVGKNSGRYRANFEANIVMENLLEKRTHHLQGVLIHEYENDESDSYTPYIDWQTVGESAELGNGAQLGLAALWWLAESAIQDSTGSN